jgi:hypothetical protein
LTAFWLLPTQPLLSAQNPKALMTDACHNELQQRKEHVLWASQVERRTAGHVYREREIDTVDGPVLRLLSIDGREPSVSERKEDDERLRNLLKNSKARLTQKKDREEQEKKVDDLLRALPDIFVFEDQGTQGTSERLAFSPNPRYKPSTYEEVALHALSGIVLIDLREKRIAQFSGTLKQQVNFAHGLLGHLNKGGVVEVNRVQLSAGLWGTSLFRTDLDGRFALFKNISKHLYEIRSHFESVSPQTDIQDALDQMAREVALSTKTTQGKIERSHESKKAF